MENCKIKHLEFIQSVINRMNTNSFQIKGWTITIVSALLALYANSSNTAYIFIAIVPTILFSFLDSYYLQLERKFRGVYNDIIKDENTIPLFSMPLHKYIDGNYRFCCVFWSKTIWCFYLIIALALLIGGLILKFKDCITFNC